MYDHGSLVICASNENSGFILVYHPFVGELFLLFVCFFVIQHHNLKGSIFFLFCFFKVQVLLTQNLTVKSIVYIVSDLFKYRHLRASDYFAQGLHGTSAKCDEMCTWRSSEGRVLAKQSFARERTELIACTVLRWMGDWGRDLGYLYPRISQNVSSSLESYSFSLERFCPFRCKQIKNWTQSDIAVLPLVMGQTPSASLWCICWLFLYCQ